MHPRITASALFALSLLLLTPPAVGSPTGTAVDTSAISPPAPSSPSAPAFKKAGDAFAKKGQTEKAMAAYRQFVDCSGAGPATYRTARTLGEYFYRNRKYNEAASYLSMVKGREQEPVSVRAMLGISLFRTGKYQDAIDALTPVAASSSLKAETKRDVLRSLGEAYFRTERIDKAVSWYDKYLQAGGSKVADLSYAAARRSESTSPAKALQRYAANTKSFPDDYRNYLRLSVLTAGSTTSTKSAAYMKKATTLAVKVPGAWLDIARAYGELGRTDAEMGAYAKYLKVDPASLEARTRTGAILLAKGRTTEALRVLEAAHRQAPDSAGPMAGLAAAWLKTGKAAEAAEMLEKAKLQAPKDPAVRRNLFEAYRSLGRDQQALDEITALLDLRRDNAAVLDCANLLIRMQRYDEAVGRLEDIRAADPENIDAIMALAMALRGQQKYEDAVGLYKEANALDNKYAPALYERAETHLLQGKPNWAQEFYERALALDPKMALAHLGLAKAAAMRQNRQAYLKHLNRAAALDPRNPRIAQELQNSREDADGAARGGR